MTEPKILRESNPPNRSEAFFLEVEVSDAISDWVCKAEKDKENVIMIYMMHSMHIAEGGQP